MGFFLFLAIIFVIWLILREGSGADYPAPKPPNADLNRAALSPKTRNHTHPQNSGTHKTAKTTPNQSFESLTLSTHVAGFPHRVGKNTLPSRYFRVGDRLTLVRDSKNAHDANAIRLLKNGQFLGFVAKADNSLLAQSMDSGQNFSAKVTAVSDLDAWKGIKILVTPSSKLDA
jgi:hypothetical protein